MPYPLSHPRHNQHLAIQKFKADPSRPSPKYLTNHSLVAANTPDTSDKMRTYDDSFSGERIYPGKVRIFLLRMSHDAREPASPDRSDDLEMDARGER